MTDNLNATLLDRFFASKRMRRLGAVLLAAGSFVFVNPLKRDNPKEPSSLVTENSRGRGRAVNVNALLDDPRFSFLNERVGEPERMVSSEVNRSSSGRNSPQEPASNQVKRPLYALDIRISEADITNVISQPGPLYDAPRPVIKAAVVAESILASQGHECRVPWQFLAVLILHESNLGRHEGSSVTPRGDTTKRISSHTKHEAVGFAQFYDDLWADYAKRFNLDGNNDGREDPSNAYDGMLAASIYQCRNASEVFAGLGIRDVTPEQARIGFLKYCWPADITKCPFDMTSRVTDYEKVMNMSIRAHVNPKLLVPSARDAVQRSTSAEIDL